MTPRLNSSFYHIKNLQSTKTGHINTPLLEKFYHIKNLQSTKTLYYVGNLGDSFITLRIYKVLKPLLLTSLAT